MQRIKKGDTVEVIAGKDLGERGEVIEVIKKENRVVVSGVNLAKRHMRERQIGGQRVPPQIVEFDAPINVSNVMLICPSCGERTRVGFKFTEAGKKMRWCKKCKAEFK